MTTTLPAYVYGSILPHHTLRVLDLLKFPTPPVNSSGVVLISSANFSKIPSIIDSAIHARALLKMTVPSLVDIIQLQPDLARDVTEKQVVSVEYMFNENKMRLPLWVMEYWVVVHVLVGLKTQWLAAKEWLENRADGKEALDALDRLPWSYNLPRMLGGDSGSLSQFASESWLSSTHILQITEVINMELDECRMPEVRCLSQDFTDKLLAIYRSTRNTYAVDRSCQFIRQLGAGLENGRYNLLALFASVCVENGGVALPEGKIKGNHWVGVVINQKTKEILYGDPLHLLPPSELVDAINWWLDTSFNDTTSYTVTSLPCTLQTDGFSCSVLAANAIASYLMSLEHNLVHDGEDVLGLRVDLLAKIVKLIHKLDPQIVITSLDITILNHPVTTSDSFKPILTKFKPTPTRGQKRPSNTPLAPSNASKRPREKHQAVPKALDKADIPVAPLFQPPPAKPAIDPPPIMADTSQDFDSNWTDDEDGAENSGEEAFESPGDLIDIKQPPKKRSLAATGNKPGGRPRISLLDQLVVKCYKRSNPSKHLYRCVGSKCGATWSNRNRQRVFRHQRNCNHIPRELREEVRQRLASQSLSQKICKSVKSSADGVSTTTAGTVVGDSQLVDGPGTLLSFGVMKEAKARTREEKNREIDLALIVLFCVAGLPTFLAARFEWLNLLWLLNPKYNPPSRTRPEDDLIPAEAANVQRLAYLELRQNENLTLSVDGGTSRGREAFWTLHVSTEDKKVFFIEAREATQESHTAVWIRTWVLEVVNDIGPARFCSVVCDSTGNTRLFRELLADAVPTLLNLPDICHHLNNTIKDIVRIDAFKSVTATVRGVISKVHQSHLGSSEFDNAQKRLNVTKGLVAIGKTRFGTMVSAARSVQRNIPVIQQVVRLGRFSFGDHDSSFKEISVGRLSPTALNFVSKIGQLVDTGKPPLKALTFLEANDATVADVYLYWHASLQAIHDVVNDPAQEFSAVARNDIIGILNHRHNQIFGDGNLSDSADLYLAGAYLHPQLLDCDLFQHDTLAPTSTAAMDYTAIVYPSVFRRVAKFLSAMGLQEVKRGMKERLTKWNGSGIAFRDTLLAELQRYGRRQYPYNQSFVAGQKIWEWWRGIDNQEYAKILPILALKVYAVRVNSMPEERTVSTFTWLSPPLRANLSVASMTSMTQIRQYYQTTTKHHSRSIQNPSSKSDRHPNDHRQEAPTDDAEDEWLDEPIEDLEPSAYLDVDSSLANMNSGALRSVLAGKKMTPVKKPVEEETVKPRKMNEADNDEDYLIEL